MSFLALHELPRRPGFGKDGRKIALSANFFLMRVPNADIYHYDVAIDAVKKTPARLNRLIIDSLVAKYAEVFQDKPVFDGKKNLYSKKPLPFGRQAQKFEVAIKEDDRERKFQVTIKWAAQVNLMSLHEALAGKGSVPQDSVQALDVVLRQMPSMSYVPVGRCFFRPPDAEDQRLALENGRQIWFGFHQSIRPSQWKTMMLNVDMSATVFYREIPVLQLLQEVVGAKERYFDMSKPLQDSQRLNFQKEIKGLQIETTHIANQKRKYRVLKLTKDSAARQKFPMSQPDGSTKDVTVEQYFKTQYKMQLKYAHLPCLHVGKPDKHTYMPMEICKMVQGQRCMKKSSENETREMIRVTARSAPERKEEIMRIANSAQFDKDPYLKAFGIQVNPSLVKFEGRVIEPPHIQYGPNDRPVFPRNGSWDMRESTFYKGVEIHTWAVLVFCDDRACPEHKLHDFIGMLIEIAYNMGMSMKDACSCVYADRRAKPEAVLKDLYGKFPKLQIVMCVLSGSGNTYVEIKKAGDTQLGIITQCVQTKNISFKGGPPSPQTIANICMKINAKLGGINNHFHGNICRVMKVFSAPVIFLGADVTHPSPGEDKKPSIAAVVGSLDATPFQYASTVKVQKHRQEIIADLKEMTKTLLKCFYQETKHKPHRIIMYRDGVSEGQFQQVLQYELSAIQHACYELDPSYQPGITFVVVQKRHHARLFAEDKRDQVGKSGNVPAGTVTDVGICHPSEYDFYLCSHNGIQGTSRPTHYHVLHDDNKFSADELQSLSFMLCHSYARCTRSVSIPAPAYYAHHVAFRARDHIKAEEGGSDLASSGGASTDETSDVPANLHDAVKLLQQKKMHFI